MSGGGLRTSLATVLRVTAGMLGPVASSAPEPTLMITLIPVAEAVGPTAPKLGTPVMFPGSTLDMPPAPRMKNGVLIGVPLTLAAALEPPPRRAGR